MLILAGGGAYYFAKRSINSDRADRAASIEKERQYLQKIRESEYAPKSSSSSRTPTASSNLNGPLSPSKSGIQDPAPAAPQKGEPTVKSEFAAAEPFRSRKGDRFS